MTFANIVNEIGKLTIEEVRENSANYCELVFFTADTALWDELMSTHLGPPTKEPGVKPSADISALTRPWGGIQKNQTLYYKEAENGYIVAMFWPWGDGELTTLKLARRNDS